MKKQAISVTQGHRADVGDYIIYRILPNSFTQSVGPFVFLDHAAPIKHSPDEKLKVVNGSGAHPHRGIATLTYVLNGEAEDFDSNGNYAKVRSGGAQWMKAGNGIIHDEALNVDPETNDLLTHGFQFWINLPSKIKAESPSYVSVQADQVARQELDDNRGWIKIIVGEYEGLVSKIPNYSVQFLYHLHLEVGSAYAFVSEPGLEYAAFLPEHEATINDTVLKQGELMVFDQQDGTIEISNDSEAAVDVLLFGGEKYKEPIVFGGPFVMNTELEIAQAYRDFHAGKYGKIKYDRSGF